MGSLGVLLTITVGACGTVEVTPPEAYTAPVVDVASPQPVTPEGRVVIAYPIEPAQWYPDLHAEPAAVDLAHLWGLPLYRIDPAGHLRPALARSVREVDGDAGWSLEIALRRGTWSDGEPVTAHDVVATLDALRGDASRAAGLDALSGAVIVDDHTVRLTFDRAMGRWPYLLAGGWSVLPEHVLRAEGLSTYEGVPEVTAGPFTIVEHEPGRNLVARAHTGAPSGAPRLAEIELAFVPEYETALGLLASGEVDAVLGYLALNPVERALAPDGVAASAPLGGTSVSLVWDGDGALGGADAAAARESVRTAVDVAPQVEGLLGSLGRVTRSLLPGRDGPWGIDVPARSLEGVEPTVLVPRWQEAPAFTARSLQRDMATFGGGAELVRLEPDVLVRADEGDGRLVERRDVPWPSLYARTVAQDEQAVRAAARAADRATRPTAEEVRSALDLLFERGHVLPLYEIGVAHAWSPRVSGLVPSGWPGLAMWNVERWQVGTP